MSNWVCISNENSISSETLFFYGSESGGNNYYPNLKEFVATWSITPTFRPPISVSVIRNSNSGCFGGRIGRMKKVSLDNNVRVLRVNAQISCIFHGAECPLPTPTSRSSMIRSGTTTIDRESRISYESCSGCLQAIWFGKVYIYPPYHP